MSKDISAMYDLFLLGRLYSKEQIVSSLKGWIDKNQNIKSTLDSPKKIEAGDIVLFNISGQNHPCVIFKKIENTCHGIVLSTKDHEHHFIANIENSRLYYRSKFTSTVVSMTEEQAKNNFVAIFDSPRELKKAVKLIKEKFKNILWQIF